MNKNDFLRAGIAMLATPMLPDVVPVSVRKEVKITDIRAYVFSNAAFVKIETDAGVSGWGESDHEFTPINGKIVGEILKTRLLGQDPFDFVPCVKQ